MQGKSCIACPCYMLPGKWVIGGSTVMSMLVMLTTLSSCSTLLYQDTAEHCRFVTEPCDVTQQSSYIDACLLESAAAKLVRHRLHKFAVRTRQTVSGVGVRLALLGQC